MAAVPGIRPPKFCLPLGWLLYVSFISIIGGGAGGSGVVGYLIAWHNWRSTLLVAVVFGVRLPDFLTEAYFGMGWGGGGGGG